MIVLSDGICFVQTIHNELDYRLPVTEGLAAFNILQARKVPSKLLVFPDENHVRRPCFLIFSTAVWDVIVANTYKWVLKHENSLVWHREVLGWINKFSGIAAEKGEVNLEESVEQLSVKE